LELGIFGKFGNSRKTGNFRIFYILVNLIFWESCKTGNYRNFYILQILYFANPEKLELGIFWESWKTGNYRNFYSW
jgi:hypothetical protein